MDQVELFIAACAESSAASQAGQHARQWLQDATTASKPYPLCLAVMDRVASADDPFRTSVVFQCLSTICHALEREWSSLSFDDISWVQRQMSALLAAPWSRGPVLNQAAYTLAVILKRQWTVSREEELAQSLINDIDRYLSDSNLQAAGLALAQNVVIEFSSQHGSALNLTWESHIACHRSFERNALRPLFEVVLRFLMSQPISNFTGRTLNFVVAVLSWSFEESLSTDKLALRSTMPALDDKSDSTQFVLKPGPQWRSIFLDVRNNLVDLLCKVHSALLQSSVADRRSALRLSRQALIHLASLQGTIFPVNDDGAQLLRFISSLCSCVLQMLSQIILEPNIDGEAVLDLCLLVQRLITVHGLKSIIQLGAAETFLGALANLTLQLVPAGGLSSTSVDTWMHESFDLLLDSWSACITKVSDLNINLQHYTDSIFKRYYQFRMETAQVSANDDNDDQFYHDESRIVFNDEQVTSIALLARVSAASSLSVLSQSLCTLASAPLSDERHESLCISISLLINIIADPFVPGELSTIPTLILNCPTEVVQGAIVSLLSLVQITVQQIQAEATRSLLSPYAIQTLISALQSFCHSYLTFDPVTYNRLQIDVPENLAHFLQKSIPEALDLSLQLIKAVLFDWNSEIEAGVLCSSLLLVVSTNSKLREKIVFCPSWSSLLSKFDLCIASAPPCTLSSDVLRPLSHGISKVVLLNPAAHSYWEVFQAHIQRLCSVTASYSIEVALDLLNGLAKCSGRVCVEKSFSFLLSALERVIPLGRSSNVLELCVTMALVHLPVLDQQRSNGFFACSLAVIGSFSKSGLSALVSEDNEVSENGFQDVERLLTLLHHCTAKDLFDFGPDSVTNGSDAAFAGLCVLLPLFSPNALVHFPEISTSLYELLSSIVVSSPEKITEMPLDSQNALLAALEFSLQGSVQASVQISGVNALKAIADYAASRDAKRPLLSAPFGQSLATFQRHVLYLLLFGSLSDKLFEPLADCLQPLIKAEPNSFNRLASSLLSDCHDEQIRHRLQNGFQLLLEGHPEATEQQRRGRFFFRQNCIAFVQQCRPLLQRK